MSSVRNGVVGAAVVGAAVAAVAALSSSCSSTPTNVPVRTFDRAQRVDVVCLKIGEINPGASVIPINPTPVREANCAPVPPNTDTTTLPFHLFALVTQRTRGEVAVVDLTAGAVIDEERGKPGINFIPVGAQPTDIAAAPDGQLTFVAAAEVNKPAIYVIDNSRILGDTTQIPQAQAGPALTLPDLPVCALPQAPGALAIVPGLGGPSDYRLAVVLPGTGSVSAKVVIIDPTQFHLAPLDGGTVPDGGVTPGSLTACPILGAIELSAKLPSSWTPGPAWDDGLKYVDGGVDLTDAEPSTGPPIPTAPSDGGSADAGSTDAGTTDAGIPLSFGALDPPRAAGVAYAADTRTLYVADSALPVIHVIDVSTPESPHELFPPLLATSVTEPGRKVSVGGLAVSPATRDFKRYLYAIDQKDGSVMVYDVTDPVTSPRVPVQRPHAELNPFQPPDRITFTAPVAAVSFVRHEWPVVGSQQGTAPTGLLCNPNPNAFPDPPSDAGPPTAIDQGAFYRANQTVIQQAIGPYRLRGIFAFVTLSNGQVLPVDVDDWDAPCRRPDPMNAPPPHGSIPPNDGEAISTDPSKAPPYKFRLASDVSAPEPAPVGLSDIDPYHTPIGFDPRLSSLSPTTLEVFFPTSAPNRMRSNFFLRNDPTTGTHIPNLIGIPQLFDLANTPHGTTGQDGLANPIILPTSSNLADPTYFANPSSGDPNARGTTLVQDPTDPNIDAFSLPSLTGNPSKAGNTLPAVRFAWEDPLVHIDQDWTVTYEGQLPNFDGLALDVSTDDGYHTLTLKGQNPLLCRRGIEDWDLSRARVAVESAAMKSIGLAPMNIVDQWTTDYIQLDEQILGSDDPYWTQNEDKADPQACWEGNLSDGTAPGVSQARYQSCADTYGNVDTAQNLAAALQRDFPILQAYDDHLVISLFAYPNPAAQTTQSRQVSPPVTDPDPAKNVNASLLKRMRCCFHHQVKFHVRTGGRWVASGSNVGYLHHITAGDGNRCVPSNDRRTVLLNARAPDLPRPAAGVSVKPPDRNSPLALRNPMFSFLMWSGAAPTAPHDHTTTQRDFVWKFTTRGSFQPLIVSLSSSANSVDPQSMRFIDSLGQLAVVDGSSQGLVLIDLNTVVQAHAPFF